MFNLANKFVNSSIFKAYEASLIKRPIVTKSLTGTVVFCIGDICAQKIEKKEKFDVTRTMMMCGIGTFVIVPQIHLWFKFLDKTVKSTGWKGAITKVVLDQSTFAPYLFTCNITCVQILKNGGRFDFEQWKEKMNNDFLGVLKKSLIIWPATNLILFRFVPPQFRLLCSNIVGAGWNCILSTVANNNNKKEEEENLNQLINLENNNNGSNPQIQL